MSNPEALETAISVTLGRERAEALRQGGVTLIQRHQMACLAAFAADDQSEAAKVLRREWKHLSETGLYAR
ncbi:MAG: hypothetical protein AB7F35_00980 [Acetobacteraceae bacterium]